MPLKPATRTVSIVVIILLAVLATLIVSVPTLQWRAKIVGMKLSGRLPELAIFDMLRWIVPGSPVYLGGLDERPTVGAAVRNVGVEDAGFIKRGQGHFQR